MTSSSTEKKPDAPAAPAATAGPPPDVVTLTINGHKLTTKKGTLLVEAAKQIGLDIPVFCYHEKLKPVGACRMCLVEIEKMPRLQTACTTPVAEGMVVKTQSEMARAGQNAVVAMLLANHPLDCPICDKGGECPLQDNTFGYGPGVSKFEEEKRHKDKAFELSDAIVLDRERCILCYRCVRFHEEIPGDRALAVIDRGNHGEIGVLEGERYDSPFSGNTIDICPVGALTSRQYRFRARPWDLKHTPSIAADDPVGSNIDVDTRDGRVLRVRPRENLGLNDVWISDRTRFTTIPVERSERLGQPLVRKEGKLVPATWFEALRSASGLIRAHKVATLASSGLSNEALAVLAENAIGPTLQVTPPSPSWLPKGNIADIPKSKSILVVGMELWTEMPMLALWVHRAVAATAAGPGGASLVVVHHENGLFRDSKAWLKAQPADLKKKLEDLLSALDGKGGSDEAKAAASNLKQGPATLLVGASACADASVRTVVEQIAGRIGAVGEAGLVGAPGSTANARGAAEIIGARAFEDPNGKDGVVGRARAGQLETLVIVGDAPGGGCPVADIGAARAVWLTASLAKSANVPSFVDVVLPLAHIYEQGGSFTNLEGRVQGFDAAGIPPGQGAERARADWEALVALCNELGLGLPKELKGLRALLSAKHAFAKNIKNNRARRTELHIV